MNAIAATLDLNAPSRELFRLLRGQPDMMGFVGEEMPESLLWRTFCELRRRGEANAVGTFLGSLKALHRRRSLHKVGLPSADLDLNEHKLVEDPTLGELWKAYKRCIQAQRTGPAAQLLRDLESRLQLCA
jgi:hypothetical protein